MAAPLATIDVQPPALIPTPPPVPVATPSVTHTMTPKYVITPPPGHVIRPEVEDEIFRVQDAAEMKVLRLDHRIIGTLFVVYTVVIQFLSISNEFEKFRDRFPIFYGIFILAITIVIVITIMTIHGTWWGNRKKRSKKAVNDILSGDDDLGIEDEELNEALNKIYGK